MKKIPILIALVAILSVSPMALADPVVLLNSFNFSAGAGVPVTVQTTLNVPVVNKLILVNVTTITNNSNVVDMWFNPGSSSSSVGEVGHFNVSTAAPFKRYFTPGTAGTWTFWLGNHTLPAQSGTVTISQIDSIEDMIAEIEALKAEISTLTQQIADLQTLNTQQAVQIAALQAQVTSLQTSLDAANAQNTALTQENQQLQQANQQLQDQLAAALNGTKTNMGNLVVLAQSKDKKGFFDKNSKYFIIGGSVIGATALGVGLHSALNPEPLSREEVTSPRNQPRPGY